jgi:hypothetical protein
VTWNPIVSNILDAPIGSFVEGGYLGGFVSLTQDGVPSYALIVAPIAAQSGLINFLDQSGQFDLPIGLDVINGQNNTELLINNYVQGGAKPALYAKNLVFNGFDDWYLPALLELEIIYYNLAPNDPFIYRDFWYVKAETLFPNDPVAAGQQKFNSYYSYAQNPYAVPSRATVPYTTTIPGKTNITIFQEGQPQAFLFNPTVGVNTEGYWTSSRDQNVTGPNVWIETETIAFNSGAADDTDTSQSQSTWFGRVRPVRKVAIITTPWNEINDSQTPGWTPVSTAQTPGWGPV